MSAATSDPEEEKDVDEDGYNSDEAAEAFLASTGRGRPGEGKQGAEGGAQSNAAAEGEGNDERSAARALLEGLRMRARVEAEEKVQDHFSRPGTARSHPGTARSSAED